MRKDITYDRVESACNSSTSMREAAMKLDCHFNTFKRYAMMFGLYKPNQSHKGNHINKPHQYSLEQILNGEYPQIQTYKLKQRLLKEGVKENKCEICGCVDWNGKLLSMELHHIDGNSSNHKLDNLMMLCPNCHAQTNNYRSKNRKN